MNQTIKKISLTLFLVVAGTLTALAISYAWSEPTDAPPGGNISSFLNSLGIGTTNPGSPLAIMPENNNPLASGIRIHRAGENETFAFMEQDGGGNAVFGSKNTGGFGGILFRQGDGSAIKTPLFIDSNGSIGINASAGADPNYKITVVSGGIKLNSTSTPAAYLSSASGHALLVDSGNVGIGTMDPKAKLEVNGDVRIFGDWDASANKPNWPYKANSDGFVTAYIIGKAGVASGIIDGFTDAQNPPKAKRGVASFSSSSGADRASFMMPVKNGDYWMVKLGAGVSADMVSINWIPLGISANSTIAQDSTLTRYFKDIKEQINSTATVLGWACADRTKCAFSNQQKYYANYTQATCNDIRGGCYISAPLDLGVQTVLYPVDRNYMYLSYKDDSYPSSKIAVKSETLAYDRATGRSPGVYSYVTVGGSPINEDSAKSGSFGYCRIGQTTPAFSNMVCPYGASYIPGDSVTDTCNGDPYNKSDGMYVCPSIVPNEQIRVSGSFSCKDIYVSNAYDQGGTKGNFYSYQDVTCNYDRTGDPITD